MGAYLIHAPSLPSFDLMRFMLMNMDSYILRQMSLKMLFMSSRNITQLSVFRRIQKIAKIYY
jgi:hypothetical protein